MKPLSKHLLTLLLCLTTAAAFSQTSSVKPKLFANLPENIAVETNTLEKVFYVPVGLNISLAFGGGLVFNGKVSSNEIKYKNLRTVTVISSELNNSILAVSMITNSDNTITYVGRIINPGASDGYEIKKSVTGDYRLQKFQTDKILQDCSYN